MIVHATDVLVLGGGTAALRAATAASDAGAAVMVLQKGPANLGIVAFNAPVPDGGDTPAQFFTDMIVRGQFLCDFSVAAALTGGAIDAMRYLEKQGMSFLHQNGSYAPRLTSGNTRPRTVYSSDRTGPQILSVLLRILRSPEVPVLHNKQVLQILVKDGQACGALVVDLRRGEFEVYLARATVLATGGLGQLYAVSSNHPHLTGDGYMLAYRAGAELVDLEFVQFEPFVIRAPQLDDLFGISFLLDDGPRIYNVNKEEFLPDRAVNLPKDILSRLLFKEIQSGRGTTNGGIYFDVIHVSPEKLALHPRFLAYCQRAGIDPTTQPFEAGPAQHYMMGGVRIDERAQTGVPGLFAAGEAAGGVHGADRLAGNSGTDVLVFGAIAGASAAAYACEAHAQVFSQAELQQIALFLDRFQGGELDQKQASEIYSRLKGVMWDKVGLVRSTHGLSSALGSIRDLQCEAQELNANGLLEQVRLWELENQLLLAEMICRSAALRQESRGVHFHMDFPARDDKNWIKKIAVRMDHDQQVESHLQPGWGMEPLP
jgi:succinate dehydrogenase/fumarate reductase flavoprotein subunit